MEVAVGHEQVIRTVCDGCPNCCGLLTHVKNGVLTKVEPAEFPNPMYRHICLRGLCTPKLVYHPDRLKYPMKRVGERGDGKWQRISWDEALDMIALKFKEVSEKYGAHSVGWIFGPEGHVQHTSMQRFASATGGTFIEHIGPGDAAGFCGDIVSYGNTCGGGYTTNFQSPRVCVVWGGNYSETSIHLYRAISDARERGTRVVVIDPRFTPTAAKADEWIPIRPGTDAALALGMINVLIHQELQDEPFLIRHTVGPFLVRKDNGLFLREQDIPGGEATDRYVIWDTNRNRPETHDRPGVAPALRGFYRIDGIECKPAFELLVELVEQYPLEKVSAITEIDSDTINRLALEYGTDKPVASYRSYGLQRTFHGDLAYRAVTALAAVTGNVKLECKDNIALPYETIFGRPRGPVRQFSAMKMYEATLNMKTYPFKALWVSRKNWVNQFPNLNRLIREILPRLEFIVAADMFKRASVEYADIVLPLCSFCEGVDLRQTHITFGGPPYIQLQQKVIEPLYECKTEFDIMTELAPRMGIGEYFDKSIEDFIHLFLSSGSVAEAGVTLEDLRRGILKEVHNKPVTISTPSRRIEFYSEKLREFAEELPVYKEPLESARQPRARKYPLCFIQGHTRFRFHSNLANVDWLRDLDPGPVLEINPVDADERGIKDGDMVAVFNDRGKMKVKAMVHEGIKPGVVNTDQGWWFRHFAEGSHQALTHDVINPAQEAIWEPNAAYFDVSVEVQKAEER